jgi:hypothetical protein
MAIPPGGVECERIAHPTLADGKAFPNVGLESSGPTRLNLGNYSPNQGGFFGR